jgi:hypothetical protein
LAVKAERGYLIPAVNTEHTDYVSMARQLSRSLKAWHPEAITCLLTDHTVDFSEFDFVETLPQGNQGGFHNDWQAWSASPFRETIKLEADMLVSGPIDHWWTLLRNRDVVISTGARDFYNNSATSRYYRNIFDANNLPDVYNAITYWRVSQHAQQFWKTVRMIFCEWSSFKTLLKFAPDTPDTDLVYALAATLLGEHTVTLPPGMGPTIVHMKQHVIATHSKDWTKELVWEHVDHTLRINTVAQWGCVHYHVKGWNPDEQ